MVLEKDTKLKGRSLAGIVQAYLVRGDDRKIKLGKEYIGTFLGDKDYVTYTVDVGVRGELKIDTDRRMEIILENDKVKNTYYTDNNGPGKGYSTTIAVEKGTYDLKLSGVRGDFKFKCRAESITSVINDKSMEGIDVGNSKKFVIVDAEDKGRVHWIRIEVKKPTSIELRSTWLGGNGKLNFRIAYSGRSDIYFNEYYINTFKRESAISVADNGKWPAGVYYIGVSKEDVKASGVFKIEAIEVAK